MIKFLIISGVIVGTAIFFFYDGYKRGFDDGVKSTRRPRRRQPEKEWEYKQHRTN